MKVSLKRRHHRKQPLAFFPSCLQYQFGHYWQRIKINGQPYLTSVFGFNSAKNFIRPLLTIARAKWILTRKKQMRDGFIVTVARSIHRFLSKIPPNFHMQRLLRTQSACRQIGVVGFYRECCCQGAWYVQDKRWSILACKKSMSIHENNAMNTRTLHGIRLGIETVARLSKVCQKFIQNGMAKRIAISVW